MEKNKFRFFPRNNKTVEFSITPYFIIIVLKIAKYSGGLNQEKHKALS
jgi:hypothetical protein